MDAEIAQVAVPAPDVVMVVPHVLVTPLIVPVTLDAKLTVMACAGVAVTVYVIAVPLSGTEALFREIVMVGGVVMESVAATVLSAAAPQAPLTASTEIVETSEYVSR